MIITNIKNNRDRTYFENQSQKQKNRDRICFQNQSQKQKNRDRIY